MSIDETTQRPRRPDDVRGGGPAPGATLTDEERAARQARAEELERALLCLNEAFERQRLRSVATVDQLIAHLRALARPVEQTAEFDQLPRGLRKQLIEAAHDLLAGAMMGLEHEWTEPRPSEDVHQQVIDMLEVLITETREDRVHTRATVLACDMVPDDGDPDPFIQVSWDLGLMDELIARWGDEPSDEVIRAFLREHAVAPPART